MKKPGTGEKRQCGGFTLIEVVSVIGVLAILLVVAIPRYFSVIRDSRQASAKGLTAAAQSQLTLEYSRRVVAGLDLTIAAQDVCNMTALSTDELPATMVCTGNLSDAVVDITATVDGESVNANWSSPQSGS